MFCSVAASVVLLSGLRAYGVQLCGLLEVYGHPITSHVLKCAGICNSLSHVVLVWSALCALASHTTSRCAGVKSQFILAGLVAQIPYSATMIYIWPCKLHPTILQSCRAHHGCVCSSHLPTPANDIVFVTVPPPADGVPRERRPFNFNSFCWILCEAMWWFYQRAWKILVRGWPCQGQRMCTCRGQRMCTWLYTP
jgi:hypothetical protein